MYKRQTPVTVE